MNYNNERLVSDGEFGKQCFRPNTDQSNQNARKTGEEFLVFTKPSLSVIKYTNSNVYINQNRHWIGTACWIFTILLVQIQLMIVVPSSAASSSSSLSDKQLRQLTIGKLITANRDVESNNFSFDFRLLVPKICKNLDSLKKYAN